MRLKAKLQNRLTRTLFSAERLAAKRRKLEAQRQAKNLPHMVEYFHQVSDPYSHLLVQMLPEFSRKYDVALRVHITPPPPDWAAPDRARLDAYARQDAAALAQRMGLNFTDPGEQPSSAAIAAAQNALFAVENTDTFMPQAYQVGEQLWQDKLAVEAVEIAPSLTERLQAATARRDALGHYLGGVLYYAGEWYWGPDRLHFLEARLRDLGAAKPDAAPEPIFAPPLAPIGQSAKLSESRPELHWYLSFRSPYTGIVRDRIKQLADVYGAELKLRYVLPMVMRGMQVPRKKGFYIMADTLREAERLGVSFGNVMDPVGRPVERGYAILHEAIKRGQGYAFAQSFLAGVWAEGIDAGSDRGLKQITERAGLPWLEMKPLLATDHWRTDAEANQQEMFSYGLWGVPSFRVGQVATWGQDRLWRIEEELVRITQGEGETRASH